MSHILRLEVPEAVHKTLSKKAKQLGQSTETLAAKLLIAATQEPANDPVEKFIGAFNSRGTDWVDQHDKYIGCAAMETVNAEVSDSQPND